MLCREFREIADSYLSNELIVETNHRVISHLEQCAECRQELKARRDLRGKLRGAFLQSPENQLRPEFADRLRTQLHDYALSKRGAPPLVSTRGWRYYVRRRPIVWIALAACLVLIIGAGLILVRQLMVVQPKADEIAVNKQRSIDSLNPTIPVGIVKTELARSAVGDHRDCAIKFRLAEKPIDLEVAGQKYDRVYVNLTKAVLSQQGAAPLDAQFAEAHSCVYQGRRFAHIVLKYHGHLVSFLVTDIEPTKRVQSESDPQVITCSEFDGYKVSCFETARHAVFVVSDLTERDNLALARALAPSVFAHIVRIENNA